MYPNPTNGTINLTINSSESGKLSYEIYDYTGRIISVENISVNAGSNSYTVDLDKEANGIYSLIIFDENNLGMESIRIVKQE